MHMYESFITPAGIEALKNYKYVPGVYSRLDYILNPYWEQITQMLPRWLAPNTITFTGLVLMLTSSFFFMIFDREMVADHPWYTYLYASFAIFTYTNLDAIDGKQARRLGKGSPLGQLFDHGCDCIGVCLLLYNVIVLWELGNDMLGCFVLCFSSMCMFYSSNWAEFHTHVLVTSNGILGVTELLLMISLFDFLTAVFGPHFWQLQPLFGPLIRYQGLPARVVRVGRPSAGVHGRHS